MRFSFRITGNRIGQHVKSCLVPMVIITMLGSASLANETPVSDDINHASSPNRVAFHDGRLSVTTKNTSIVEIMLLVGEKADIEIVAYGDLSDQTGSWSFSNLPLADAIKKLLNDINAIITFSSTSDPDAESRISKIYLLGQGSTRVSLMRINTVEPSLDNQLRMDQAQTGDTPERLAAIERSEGMVDELTVENLAFALKHDPNPVVRSRAVKALGQIGGSVAASALEAGLGDDDLAVRKKVVQALGKVEDERISLWLGQVIMGDPDVEVRLAALHAIALKDDDTARVFLEAAAGDSSTALSEAAQRLLE